MDGRLLRSLEYADDVTLIAKSRPELESMLSKLMTACASVGLEVHEGKTTLMTNCLTRKQPLRVENKTFEFVERARYLGGWISFPLDQRAELDRRVQCGWLAWS